MLDVVITKKCEKGLKRAKKRGLDIDDFFEVVEMLQRQEVLPARYHDHALVGDKHGLRDCHIYPDWVLIYEVNDDALVLLLVDTGTHADLKL